MKRMFKALVVPALAMILSGGITFAQDHPDNSHYVHHSEWRKGAKINHDDWNRGQQIDYHRYHLNAPPRGYQWREVDGNYVLAAVATGVIASVIVASTTH